MLRRMRYSPRSSSRDVRRSVRAFVERCARSVALAALLAGSSAHAVELEGLDAPEQISLEGRELQLNGIGLRTASRLFIRANIYAAALYLESPMTRADEVLDSPGFKQISLRYLYDISQADMKRAWAYSFEQNCAAACERLKPQIAAFDALVDGVVSGDLYAYRFLSDRVEIVRNGVARGSVAGAEFARLLLATWIGAAPPTEELKASLLSGGKGD